MSDPAQNIPQQLPDATQKSDDLDAKLDSVAQATKQKMHQDPAVFQTLAPTPAMQDVVIDVEKDLLAEIIRNLEKNMMSPEQAQSLAKQFLSFLPIQDQKDLLDKLYELSRSHRGLQGIYVKYAKPHEEIETQKKLELMSQHIQQGNIEHALAVAKGEING